MTPPIFIINLDNSVERLAICQDRLAKRGFSFERIPAVYGAHLTKEERDKHYDKQSNSNQFYRELSNGEIGCYFSHKAIWQKIVDEKIPYAIVLEDDFDVIGDIRKAIDTIEKLTFQWDYIKLATYKDRSRSIAFNAPFNDMNFTLFSKAMAGTCAQAVSLAGATKLVASTRTFGRPVDTDLQHWWEHDIEMLALTPYPFSPDLAIESEIAKQSPSKSHVKKHFWRRKIQQLKFHFKNKQETTRLANKLASKFKIGNF